MIEQNKCPKCRYSYEVSWDDDANYYNDNDDWDNDNTCDEELYPEYCPFCGIHREYGNECDSYDDIFNDDK